MNNKILQKFVKRFPRRLKDKKGSGLIISFLALTLLFSLTASFAISSISELSAAQRQQYATQAFWAAEAGINQFLQNTGLLDGGPQTIYFGNDFVTLTKDDSDIQERIVTALGNTNSITRSLEVRFPATPPAIFDNTLSSGGDVTLDGFIAGMQVNGNTKLTGVFNDNGFITSANFENKEENVDAGMTTFEYPDANLNGTPNEFEDFVAYNRTFVDPTDPNYTGDYTAEEVVYVQTDSTVDIWPNSELIDKKVIFVEGSTPGAGDVNVWFDSSWAADQNVTIVSTGSVSYIQPLQNPAANSQLNTISWDDYNEAAILFSTHDGVTYTNGGAHYGSIVSYSTTTGNLIANEDVSLMLIAVWKEFSYETPLDQNGIAPPAFQGLINGSPGGYSSTPSSWTEI